ncbi:MAG: glycoside hydrolase [Thermoproteota archaeon]
MKKQIPLIVLLIIVSCITVVFLVTRKSESKDSGGTTIPNPPSTGSVQNTAVSIRVDPSRKYQVIEGFGGSGAYFESLVHNLEEPLRTQVVDLLFSDLGVDIYRMRVWSLIEFYNDDDDPNHFNWDGFNFNTDLDQVWNAQQAKSRGVSKFLASVWSPPWWMKNTRKENGGGYLLPEMYEEFAEWLAAYVIGYKEHHGIEIGWISIQNEPDFSTEDWETCVYTPEQLRDVVKVVGRKFRALNLTTKILLPEVAQVSKAPDYIEVIMSDPEAAQYVDVLNFHLYDIDYFNPDSEIIYLEKVAECGLKYKRPLWETEYSYLEFAKAGTLEEALAEAQHIHNTLVYGNASAYLVWTLFWIGNGLISVNPFSGDYKVNTVYYALKHYSKFITPGSRRIYSLSTDGDILTSAFLDENTNRITVVIINRGRRQFNAELSIDNIVKTSMEQYRTSSTENCVRLPDVQSSGNVFRIVIPPESIITLVG